MKTKKIGVLIGSARKGSFTRQVADTITGFFPDDFQPIPLQTADLPLFNQDFDDEGTTPASWTAFRQQVQQLDGVLIFTPEYNRSYPPLLKNALDIASRPPGQNAWSGKPCGIVGVSPGKMGGFGAVQHLRQVLSFLNLNTMNQPEAYVSGAMELFDEQGQVTDNGSKQFLQDIAAAYVQWVNSILNNA